MVNALTRKTGLTLGPIILETLVKHYFERLSNAHDEEETTRLRKEELLYRDSATSNHHRPHMKYKNPVPAICHLRIRSAIQLGTREEYSLLVR